MNRPGAGTGGILLQRLNINTGGPMGGEGKEASHGSPSVLTHLIHAMACAA